MGMLGRFFNTNIVDVSWTYFAERNELRAVKTKMIEKIGISNLLFISEGLNFYYIWNLILQNDPPKEAEEQVKLIKTTQNMNILATSSLNNATQ